MEDRRNTMTYIDRIYTITNGKTSKFITVNRKKARREVWPNEFLVNCNLKIWILLSWIYANNGAYSGIPKQVPVLVDIFFNFLPGNYYTVPFLLFDYISRLHYYSYTWVFIFIIDAMYIESGAYYMYFFNQNKPLFLLAKKWIDAGWYSNFVCFGRWSYWKRATK